MLASRKTGSAQSSWVNAWGCFWVDKQYVLCFWLCYIANLGTVGLRGKVGLTWTAHFLLVVTIRQKEGNFIALRKWLLPPIANKSVKGYKVHLSLLKRLRNLIQHNIVDLCLIGRQQNVHRVQRFAGWLKRTIERMRVIYKNSKGKHHVNVKIDGWLCTSAELDLNLLYQPTCKPL